MSTKGNLSREEAVAIVGEKAVDSVESKNCEPSGRVGYNGETQGDELCEWTASIRCKDADGVDCTLIAYYYTTNEDDREMADAGDGSAITWEVAGFEVV